MALTKERLNLLTELEQFARENDRMWNIPPETGRFLYNIACAVGAKNIVEVGMSNGYSGLWFASALEKTEGRLTTLEADPWKVELATANFERAGVRHLVDIHHGDALETISGLKGPFDLAFIDASKEQYLKYLKALLPKIAPGSLIFADNAISHQAEMQDYLDFVVASDELDSVLVPIGTGLMMSRKLLH